MMIPETELKLKEDIKLLQEEKLRELMKYLSEKSKFYQDYGHNLLKQLIKYLKTKTIY